MTRSRMRCAIVLVLALAGCGPQQTTLTDNVSIALQGLLSPEQPVDPNAVKARLTPEALAQVDVPFLLAEIPEQQVVATMFVGSESGPYRTWLTLDNVSLTLNEGILTQTRGIGFDLMSADTRDVEAFIASGQGAAQGVRIYRYLDGRNEIAPRSFVCTYTRSAADPINSFGRLRSGALVEEDCASSDSKVKNSYFVGADGTIWRSRQWIGPELGYAVLELLVP